MSLSAREQIEVAIRSGQELVGANFAGVDLTAANLDGANLPRVSFVEADLTNVSLRFATLTGADLSRANLTDANFFGADLRFARFSDAILSRTDLGSADLLGVQGMSSGADDEGHMSPSGHGATHAGGHQSGSLDNSRTCSKCAGLVSDDANFCQKCGNPLGHNL